MNQDWGLVLSGGGAKGAYQMGVWKAMKELQIEYWIGGIAGASIGALNSVLFASNNYEKGNEAWEQVNLLSVFDTEWALLDGKIGTFSREEMLVLARKYGELSKVTQSNRPIYCSISKVLPDGSYQGEYQRMDGKTQYVIEQLLMASSALPILHEPVEFQGKLYQDGGLTDNCPIRPLYDHGFRKIIIIGLKAEMKRFEVEFPDVEFISIYPSHDLGDLVHGTLNFKPRFIQFCKKLGYKDGLRIFRAYQNGDLSNAVKMQELAQLDYQELAVEVKQTELQDRVDDHMGKLHSIMDKYGI